MKKTSNSDGTTVGYPDIEVILDFIRNSIERLENTQKLTLRIALPILHQVSRKLDEYPKEEIFGGVKIIRWPVHHFIQENYADLFGRRL